MPLPVTCPACGKSFSISDDVFEQKIKGRVVTVKCKQCQAPIRVDGTKGLAAAKVGPVPAAAGPAAALAAAAIGPAPGAPAPAVAEPAAPPAAEPAARAPAEPLVPAPATLEAAATPQPPAASPPAVAPKPAGTPLARAAAGRATPAARPEPSPTPAARPEPSPTPAARPEPSPTPAARPEPSPAGSTSSAAASSTAAADSNLFAVDLPGGDREFTETQIADQLSTGKIGPETLVWREGMSEWLEIRKVPDLARHMKKPAAKPAAAPDTAALPKAQPAAAKPAAPAPGATATATATGRFRPRQPTLPMGMMPDSIQATLPQVRPIEAPAAPALPTPPAPSAAPALPIPPAPSAAPALPIPPAPSAAPALPTPQSRLPAVPLSRAATSADNREGPAGFAARERAAALLQPSPERKETPRVGSVRAQLPVVPMPEQMLDEEPTILRPSPFDALDATPAPRAPLPTPVRELLARHGQGDQPSAPRAAPLERKFPSPPPSPPSPPSRPSPPPGQSEPPPVPRIDTYRATPEAKRSWFPEPGSEPAPPPAPPAASSPFPVGAPRAVPPSSPFAAPMPSAAFGAPNLPMAAPTAPVTFDEVAALRGPKKRTMAIVAAVVVAVLIVIAVLLLGGGSAKLPPPAPAPEPHAATPRPTSEARTAQPSSAANDPASDPEKSPASGAPLRGAPTPNSQGGFAEMFAQGAKQAGGPSAGSGFDSGAAKAALDALLNEAARCREPGGPQGVARVAVTFAPNGGVSSATIAEPPFAGTSVGNCVSEAMKRARIKPFSGPPGNLTERVSIR